MVSSGDGIKIEIEALGDVQISRRLLRFGDRALNPAPIFASIYEDLLTIEKVQFLTEGGHGSAGWAPLADSTVEAKQRKGEEPWIERASETLFKSLTESGGEHQIHEFFRNWMRFGSDVPYAMFQQTGTGALRGSVGAAPGKKRGQASMLPGHRGMPMRKLIDLKLSERVAIVKKIQLFIVHGEIGAL